MLHRGLIRYPAVVLATAALLIAAQATRSTAATNPPASRYASIVLDAETGDVLYERNADLPRYPASLTKIMTLYLAFEAIGAKKLTLTEQLVMSAHAVSRDPSRLDLAPGSKLKVEDAIRAMTTKSANDAAAAIAERLAGGNESRFAQMMTAKAKKLGLAHTTFRNASGLPEDGQVTTARDLALLCQAMIRDFPEQYRYFSMRTFDYHGTRYPNQNRFLRTYYGADGIKTGFVNASGHNLAASAVRGGKRLIAVVLGGDTQGWTREHTTRLLDVSYAKVDPSLVMVASATSAEGTAATPVVATAAQATPPANAPAAPTPPTAETAPAVTMVTYATPAGAVTRPSTAALPLPNGTANLAAYASAASAPSIPAGSVPASPPLPSSPTPADAATAAEASPSKPSPIAPLDPAPQAAAEVPVPAADTTAAIRATEQAVERRPAAGAASPTPTAASPEAAAQATPGADRTVSTAQRPAVSRPAAVTGAPVPAKTGTEATTGEAAPSEQRVVTNDGGGDWSVQVGLYRDATVARRRGEEARQRMPLALRNADLVVDRALDGVHVTSRIGRLSEQEARAACSELQRGSFPCVVVPPGRPLIVATN